MRNLIRTFVVGALMSLVFAAPVRGQNNYVAPVVTVLQQVAEIAEQKPEIMYAKTEVNVRSGPGTKHKIISTLRFNEKVKVLKYDKWGYICKGKHKGWICLKYLTSEECEYREYWIPEYSGYKSYMSWWKISDESSPQWVLQQEAYTGDYGIRMINGRYCVAIGFYFNPKIGQYFDLVLENGAVIPCIIADEKDPYDTDGDNLFTSDNGCCTEFVVDDGSLPWKVLQMGDISYVCDEWMSPVEVVKIYDRNVMEE